jgi:two-component system response regulator NreC
MLAVVGFPILSTALRGTIAAAPGLRVVAEAATRDAIAEHAREAQPDVIVLECESAGGFGCGTYDAIRELRAACPGARIIALDCRSSTGQYAVALKAGADGYLTREARDSDVVAAIRNVAAGHAYVSPAIVTRMVDAFVRGTADARADDPYQALPDREREILLLAAMGHTNRAIAASLGLTEATVHYHRANVMEKLGLHDRVELLRYAVRRGLLSPSVL